MTNTLYYGDNLDILRQYVPDESVDLVYLDPPFNSNASYNILFRERSGEESPAQIKAFTDTWEWTQESERVYEREIITNPDAPYARQGDDLGLSAVRRRQRHDGLPGDDGAAPRRVAIRPSTRPPSASADLRAARQEWTRLCRIEARCPRFRWPESQETGQPQHV